MRIALYHNTDIHHEMLGYLIEYCNTAGHKLHIYFAFDDKSAKDWINYYNIYFENSFGWINKWKILDEVNYDTIFLITDDNLQFPFIDPKYYHKIVCIDHWHINRRPEIEYHIGVRRLIDRPNLPYAIPTYNIILPEEKKYLMKSVSRIQVLFVGRFNIPTSTTFQFFDNFDEIDFHIVRLKKDEDLFKYLIKTPNMYFHYDMKIDELINLMKKSHYVFLMPSYVEGYVQYKLSSLIPQSFSTLCQVILPQTWNQQLKLKSVIEYNDHQYLRPNKEIKLDISNFDKVIDNLYQERCEIIQHNKTVLDNAINTIIQKS